MIEKKRAAAARAVGELLIAARLTPELVGRYRTVLDILEGLTRSAESREQAGPFLQRLLLGHVDIVSAWLELQAIGAANEPILADRRADFAEATSRLEFAIVQMIERTLELHGGASVEDDILDLLQTIEREALALMGMVANPRNTPTPTMLAGKGVIGNTLVADRLEQEFGCVLISALTLRSALVQILCGTKERRRMTGAEHARLYRARRRRRVAFQATVDIYDDDLTLFRSFGFLFGSEREDQQLVTKQLESLLLYAILTYPHSPMPWRERVARQRGRLGALAERK